MLLPRPSKTKENNRLNKTDMKKILYYFLGFLLFLVLVYVGICAIAPKNIDVERSLTIDAPKNMLFNMVDDFKTWEKWSPWYDKDPEMKVEYGATTQGVGASYSWSGNKEVGSGSMTTTESKPGLLHKSDMLFEGMGEPSTAEFNFNELDGKTEVVWKHYGGSDISFLQRGIVMMLGLKGSLEKDFENGLNKIAALAKERVTNKMYDGYKINEITQPEKHFIHNRQEVGYDNVQQFYAGNLGGLFGKAQSADVEMDGKPCGLFYKFNDATRMVDMSAAIPIKEPLAIRGAQSLTLPESNAISVDYYGDYNGTPAAHAAVQSFMRDYGILNNPPYIEEYVTDPGEEPDPKKWLTKITYYISE